MRSSVHANGGRPSVCLSVSSGRRRCCGFAAVGPAAGRYRSIAARPAAGGQQHRSHATARRAVATAGRATLSADVGSWTQTCSFLFLILTLSHSLFLLIVPIAICHFCSFALLSVAIIYMYSTLATARYAVGNCRWEQHPAIVNAFYNPNTNDIGKCCGCSQILPQWSVNIRGPNNNLVMQQFSLSYWNCLIYTIMIVEPFLTFNKKQISRVSLSCIICTVVAFPAGILQPIFYSHLFPKLVLQNIRILRSVTDECLALSISQSVICIGSRIHHYVKTQSTKYTIDRQADKNKICSCCHHHFCHFVAFVTYII